MIQVARPFFRNKQEILKALKTVLDSGRLMNGENTALFESEFSRFCGSPHAISVNSCTTALEITLRFFDIRNREVIIPANTFIATGNAVFFAGGFPILADIKENTYNIDINEIKQKITEKTKGVIVVHIAGIPCEDINEIHDLCRENNLFWKTVLILLALHSTAKKPGPLEMQAVSHFILRKL
jgi:perosamine synthetase